MFRTYRTKKATIMGTEAKSIDITLTLITSVDGKEYVMAKMQGEKALYTLSLIGHVTEIVDDVSFEEFRELTYARPNKSRQH